MEKINHYLNYNLTLEEATLVWLSEQNIQGNKEAENIAFDIKMALKKDDLKTVYETIDKLSQALNNKEKTTQEATVAVEKETTKTKQSEEDCLVIPFEQKAKGQSIKQQPKKKKKSKFHSKREKAMKKYDKAKKIKAIKRYIRLSIFFTFVGLLFFGVFSGVKTIVNMSNQINMLTEELALVRESNSNLEKKIEDLSFKLEDKSQTINNLIADNMAHSRTINELNKRLEEEKSSNELAIKELTKSFNETLYSSHGMQYVEDYDGVFNLSYFSEGPGKFFNKVESTEEYRVSRFTDFVFIAPIGDKKQGQLRLDKNGNISFYNLTKKESERVMQAILDSIKYKEVARNE